MQQSGQYRNFLRLNKELRREGLSLTAAERQKSGVIFRQQFSKRSNEFVGLQGEPFLQLKSQKQELSPKAREVIIIHVHPNFFENLNS